MSHLRNERVLDTQFLRYNLPGARHMSNIIHINDSNFETEVLASTQPVIVEFGATWCGPCQRQAPILEKYSQENKADADHVGVKVCAVDIDDAPAITAKLGIRSVPSLLFFENGKQTGMKVGLTSFREI